MVDIFFYAILQDIIRLPRLFGFLQRPMARLISTLRAPKSKEGYALIGGGSPLRRITDEQVLRFHKNFWFLPLHFHDSIVAWLIRVHSDVSFIFAG